MVIKKLEYYNKYCNLRKNESEKNLRFFALTKSVSTHIWRLAELAGSHRHLPEVDNNDQEPHKNN